MKVKNHGSNQTLISWHINGKPVELLFSYETPVAGCIGCLPFASDTFHSKTTSKHINKYIRDNGVSVDAAPRVPQTLLDEIGNANSDPSKAWLRLSQVIALDDLQKAMA